MARFVSHVQVTCDTDREEFTASVSFCEPAPGLCIEQPIEGTGETFTEALRNLAENFDLAHMREDALA